MSTVSEQYVVVAVALVWFMRSCIPLILLDIWTPNNEWIPLARAFVLTRRLAAYLTWMLIVG